MICDANRIVAQLLSPLPTFSAPSWSAKVGARVHDAVPLPMQHRPWPSTETEVTGPTKRFDAS